ncbi:MAG: ArsR/SmtB family transcription factor [Dehalococcoidia bacterium]
MEQEPFEPVPFLIVDSPEQLKAFTDPLRSRALTLLAERAATNQQVAQALGEPHAKVLHHVRYLLDAGLIRLVETRIKGGNVEKYYRAVARMFGVRPGRDLYPDVVNAEIQALSQEVAASAAIWPEKPDQPRWEGRRARLNQERVDEFYTKLLDLIREYWGGPRRGGGDTQLAQEDPSAPMFALSAIVYRDPTDPTLGT